MNCFFGTNNYQLDSKNRMRLPAKFRTQMGKEYLLTIGTGGCLYVLDKETYESMVADMAKINKFDNEGSNLIRQFTRTAELVDSDEQGRFVLPMSLKAYAQIDKNICIIGAGDKIEIWSQEIWDNTALEANPENMKGLFEGLSKYGI